MEQGSSPCGKPTKPIDLPIYPIQKLLSVQVVTYGPHNPSYP